jgi:hypothetical protein
LTGCSGRLVGELSVLINFRELGFADPVKMFTSGPAILSYAVENIRNKITTLSELGFSDPVMMIDSLPAILGYAIGGVRNEIAFCVSSASRSGEDDHISPGIETKPPTVGRRVREFVSLLGGAAAGWPLAAGRSRVNGCGASVCWRPSTKTIRTCRRASRDNSGKGSNGSVGRGHHRAH